MAKKKVKGDRKTLSVNFKTPFVVGHKLSVGHGEGRPAEIDYEAEAIELDKWSKLPDSITLYGFTDDKRYCAQDLTDFAKRCTNFALALRKAKERISRHRVAKLNAGELHQAAFNRNASLHDRMLYDHEEHIKDRQAERDKKIAQVGAENLTTFVAAVKADQIKQHETLDNK